MLCMYSINRNQSEEAAENDINTQNNQTRGAIPMRRRMKRRIKKQEVSHDSKWQGHILNIYDPVFRQKFYFILAETYEEYKVICKRATFNVAFSDNMKYTNGGFTVIDIEGVEICLFWANAMPAVVHECFHAVSYALGSRDIFLTGETDEVYAYYVEFLVEEVLGNLIY